jgi:hypothetical protein
VENLDADAQKAYGWYRESSTPDSIAASMAEFRDVWGHWITKTNLDDLVKDCTADDLTFPCWLVDRVAYSDWIHEAWMMYQYALVLREQHKKEVE